ncbi:MULTISPECIES: bifunctional aminoglycoside phosphotransferase/ATP-binding protein [Prosthecochloris]|uniref:Aminoglycoside phosphotransferase domain-containing protein n=1 Tax=Prosthecochloris vibrioformis TaxID=1098 RepID=A0A5C4RYK5_PROVB|nr:MULTISPECIES: bifunctional aminoglycoside phosphotransferase/ATP-binding protein [Prosthecochloris]TNJ36105.1 hypothetical protein FGF68_08690 [Prosthecochloris vibrioformis]
MAGTSLLDPAAYLHNVETIELVETHISRIYLTGHYAYKLKKPVNLGFLDFTTLDSRNHYCHEELRLNRRLCPTLYIQVLPVTRNDEGITIGGSGDIIDYAVQMKQFDRTGELDSMLREHRLEPHHIDMVYHEVSAFHQRIPPAPPDSPWGKPATIRKTLFNNFSAEIISTLPESEQPVLKELKAWTGKELDRLESVLLQRRKNGMVRECHGDMHTGNIVLYHGNICIFDCIEFNPRLSTIDLTSDIAFFMMDLLHAGRTDLAWRFINGYMAETGDYQGMDVLRFYLVYRAMVRAKVTAIRRNQEQTEEAKNNALDEHRSYLDLARSLTTPSPRRLMLTCGIAGSGKSTLAARIATTIGALHCRSDIERKRLAGMKPLDRSNLEEKETLYGKDMSERTYSTLLNIARTTLNAGWHCIVDATFLHKAQRTPFIDLAKETGASLLIIMCNAPSCVLEKRLEQRAKKGADPSEAGIGVMKKQLRERERLTEEEMAIATEVNTASTQQTELLLRKLQG